MRAWSLNASVGATPVKCAWLTDVLLPVARDLAVDLVGAIFAGRLSQAFAAVFALRDAFPVAGLRGGALRDWFGFIIFTTCWSNRLGFFAIGVLNVSTLYKKISCIFVSIINFQQTKSKNVIISTLKKSFRSCQWRVMPSGTRHVLDSRVSTLASHLCDLWHVCWPLSRASGSAAAATWLTTNFSFCTNTFKR